MRGRLSSGSAQRIRLWHRQEEGHLCALPPGRPPGGMRRSQGLHRLRPLRGGVPHKGRQARPGAGGFQDKCGSDNSGHGLAALRCRPQGGVRLRKVQGCDHHTADGEDAECLRADKGRSCTPEHGPDRKVHSFLAVRRLAGCNRGQHLLLSYLLHGLTQERATG